MTVRLVFRVAGLFGFTSVDAVSYSERVEQSFAERLLHAARGDHVDVVGHCMLAGGRTADWLPSGAGFTTQGVDATWDTVAAAIAEPRTASGAL